MVRYINVMYLTIFFIKQGRLYMPPAEWRLV